MYKRKISLMIIVILILQIMLPILSIMYESPISATSKATVQSGNWEYTVNDDGKTITIVQYSGTEANLQIPSEIEGYTVTGLGNGRSVDTLNATYSVFEYCYLLETIKLPSTVTTISSYAFMGCNNLINIELNEGLQTIGNQPFVGCEKLEELNIPSTVFEIKNNSDLSSFYDCKNLRSITVHSDNQYYISIDRGII